MKLVRLSSSSKVLRDKELYVWDLQAEDQWIMGERSDTYTQPAVVLDTVPVQAAICDARETCSKNPGVGMRLDGAGRRAMVRVIRLCGTSTAIQWAKSWGWAESFGKARLPRQPRQPPEPADSLRKANGAERCWRYSSSSSPPPNSELDGDGPGCLQQNERRAVGAAYRQLDAQIKGTITWWMKEPGREKKREGWTLR